MQEEHRKNTKNSQQDIEIAVLAKEMEHMGKNVEVLRIQLVDKMREVTEVVRSFIEIANGKVDIEIYTEDKRQLGLKLRDMQEEIDANTEFRKAYDAIKQGGEAAKKTIWGFSQGSLSLLISILTFITLTVSVIGLFKNT